MKCDIVQRLRDWAYTICTVNSHVPPSSKAQMARDAADEIERLRADLAAAIKQRDEARENLRDACEEIAMRVNSHSMLSTNQTAEYIAAERGWQCFAQQEGGGA